MYHVKMKMVSIQVCLGLILASSTILAQTYPSGIEHVIVIGIDGMSPDGIKHASTPVMHNLIASGSVKWNVRTVLPSSSSPNWASMIMGGGTELHGITDNDWGRADYSLPPILSGDEGIFPTNDAISNFGQVVPRPIPQSSIYIELHVLLEGSVGLYLSQALL
jgi:predicted AlkP superfamily pyrophosphatase or phosphodiesterase